MALNTVSEGSGGWHDSWIQGEILLVSNRTW